MTWSHGASPAGGRPGALVFVADLSPVNILEVARQLTSLFPETRQALLVPRAEDAVLDIAGTEVAVALIDAPMSWAFDPGESRPDTEPEAMEAARRHRGHILVHPIGPPDHWVWEARVVSAVVVAVLHACPGVLAVEWCGRTLRSPGAWLESGRLAFDKQRLPVRLWASRLGFILDGRAVIVTQGLAGMLGRELELESRHGFDVLLEWVELFGSYLLINSAPGRPALKDRDTFGRTDGERIRVHHRVSPRFETPVIFASVDPDGPGDHG